MKKTFSALVVAICGLLSSSAQTQYQISWQNDPFAHFYRITVNAPNLESFATIDVTPKPDASNRSEVRDWKSPTTFSFDAPSGAYLVVQVRSIRYFSESDPATLQINEPMIQDPDEPQGDWRLESTQTYRDLETGEMKLAVLTSRGTLFYDPKTGTLVKPSVKVVGQ